MKQFDNKNKSSLKYCLYIHTSPNGKRYVGITSQKPEDRWSNGTGYCENIDFRTDIKKYGWDSFQHDIIKTNMSYKEARTAEYNAIRFYDTTDKSKGYNRDKGRCYTQEEINSEKACIESSMKNNVVENNNTDLSDLGYGFKSILKDGNNSNEYDRSDISLYKIIFEEQNKAISLYKVLCEEKDRRLAEKSQMIETLRRSLEIMSSVIEKK